MIEQGTRPTTDDRDAWSAYWEAQEMPWRTEPEIAVERQRYLAGRRGMKPDLEQGIFPFGEIQLDRADVEWLLATHESGGMRGPVDWSDPRQRDREGLDLRGANLREVDLSLLPLAHMRGGLTSAEANRVGRQERRLAALNAEWANLRGAHLEGARLARARLEYADLSGAHLERANLYATHLEGSDLTLAGLAGAYLVRAFLDADVYLHRTSLSDAEKGGIVAFGIRWGGVDVSSVQWAEVAVLGDERAARQPNFSEPKERAGKAKDPARRLQEYSDAVLANRQVATVLRNQGLNEHADRFAYRAQLLQRQVLRRQRKPGRAFGSWLLDLVSGYGYKPMRSAITYLLVVSLFGLAFWAMGVATGHTLSWNEAGVVSLTAFHGRGFFSTAFSPGDPQAALAAVEAVIGLLIEITFIATFTQRFFAR